MNLRKSCLPPGWYPQNPSKIDQFLGNFVFSREKKAKSDLKTPSTATVFAAIAPHAGWYYSGSIAAQAVAALAGNGNQRGTVAVIGGHLPEGMPALFGLEDAVSTPLGNLEIDDELRAELLNSFHEIPGLQTAEDKYHDNTVEVLLPMVKYFFPGAKLIWLRLPADMVSFESGKVLAKTAVALGKQIVVLGSTDLTHYGPNYGGSPKGYGEEALAWVKNVNDRRFIDAVEKGDPQAVLDRALKEKSSCSAGAVLGVMGFAEEVRAAKKSGENCSGSLLAYKTSADVSTEEGEGIPDSFVGYGAFVWQ